MMLLGGFVIMIVLFLIFRAVVLWYWKIDRTVDALEGIQGELELLRIAVAAKLTGTDKNDVKQSSVSS